VQTVGISHDMPKKKASQAFDGLIRCRNHF